MFYDCRIKGSHGLPHDPFKALVVPRPIGWVSTLDTEGRVNLAPFSFFNIVCYNPNVVMFSASGLPDDTKKHSWRNAEETGQFVCNIVPHALRNQMRETSEFVDRGVDEMAMAGLTPEPSQFVKPPRVKEAPAHLECEYMKTVLIESDEPYQSHGVVFGKVIGIHIKDEYIVDGLVDVMRYQPVARMGYRDYTTVDNTYSMHMPKKTPTSDE